MKKLICAGAMLGLAGCANVSSSDRVDAAISVQADVVFLGRIVDAADTEVLEGDLARPARYYVFEVLGRPGIRFEGIAWRVTCTEERLVDRAMLVIAKRANPKLGSESSFFVFACPVVDPDVVKQVLRADNY